MTDRMRDELVFVPLGGVGEIGMNMAAYGFGPAHDRKWLVVDCGVTFGGPELPGVELIHAPIRAFSRTRPTTFWLWCSPIATKITTVRCSICGRPSTGRSMRPPFTAAMLGAKRAANNIAESVEVLPMQPGRKIEIGPFTIEAITMAHSIPESCSLLIETELGRVLHTGDWKIDLDPVAGPPTDVPRLKALGEDDRPLALICDSTNAMKEGESPSEHDVSETLTRLISEAPHRVAITTFASNVGRVISVARAAAKAGRQVVLSGRALHRVVDHRPGTGHDGGHPAFPRSGCL